jgi:hypothetical protein
MKSLQSSIPGLADNPARVGVYTRFRFLRFTAVGTIFWMLFCHRYGGVLFRRLNNSRNGDLAEIVCESRSPFTRFEPSIRSFAASHLKSFVLTPGDYSLNQVGQGVCDTQSQRIFVEAVPVVPFAFVVPRPAKSPAKSRQELPWFLDATSMFRVEITLVFVIEAQRPKFMIPAQRRF